VREARTDGRLDVVIPAHQAEADIGACLEALFRAGFRQEEITVVDDGSRDATGDLARQHGVRVLRNDHPLGAAGARNRGAAEARAEIIVFVDSDVLVHADARSRILAAMADPGIAAVFGSYDARPPARGIVARYRNLLHHFVHQRSRREATTFWTGLGAVRREAFLALGGFDRAWECIEDSEFGVRLIRKGGRIILDPQLQGTHLKAWTLASMFRTDLFGRAIPWSRLILFAGGPRDDLNMTGAHRASAASVAVLLASLFAAPLAPGLLLVSAAALAAFIHANRFFLDFLRREQGLAFAAAALPAHVLHYLAGGLGLAWVLATEAPFARRRANDAAKRA
jgi:GT2 family glycosyltransferase